MSRLDEVVVRTPVRFRVAGWIIMAILAAFAVWTYFTSLDEVAIAYGEVVPQGKVKVIQHLEGGIIEKIYVTEGDVVKAGDPLVQLDITASRANRDELAVRLDALRLTAARLRAEATGKKPTFPADVAARRPDLVAGQRKAFEARRAELESGMQVLREQARQRELAIAEMKARKASLAKEIALGREQFELSKSLLAESLTPKIEHLKLERELEKLEGEMAGLKAGIPRVTAALAEARERLKEETLKFRRKAQEELGRVEVQIAQTRELLTAAADKALRTEIRSPIDGVVKSLAYHTIGGVVRPGDPIMEIVPTQDNLVIEAKLDPTDVGYVRVGQPAVVKLMTYDFVRYGGLEAEVIYVSADSHTGDDGRVYFRVIARTKKNYFGDNPGEFAIAPGMEAEVDIHTGAKSVLSYLLKPVLKLKTEAFRER